jgi:hypothetical protein
MNTLNQIGVPYVDGSAQIRIWRTAMVYFDRRSAERHYYNFVDAQFASEDRLLARS